MYPKMNAARPYAAVAALLYAVIGLSPMAALSCSSLEAFDPVVGDWVPATPTHIAPAIDEAAAATQDLAQDVSAAWLLPWIEYATRLAAVLVAFRIRPKPDTPALAEAPQE